MTTEGDMSRFAETAAIADMTVAVGDVDRVNDDQFPYRIPGESQGRFRACRPPGRREPRAINRIINAFLASARTGAVAGVWDDWV
jgi:hypothetical protein